MRNQNHDTHYYYYYYKYITPYLPIQSNNPYSAELVSAVTLQFIFLAASLSAPYLWVPGATLTIIDPAESTNTLLTRICAEAAFHAHKLRSSGFNEAKYLEHAGGDSVTRTLPDLC